MKGDGDIETAKGWDDVRPMRDLQPTGLLWLINRVVFHPRGFALGLVPGEHPEGGADDGIDDGPYYGWQMLGDGTECWTMPEDVDDKCFAAVEAFFEEVRQTARARATTADEKRR